MKIYNHPRSTFGRRVRMMVLEKGIVTEDVVLDMSKKQHRSEDYLTVNPYGKVPTLVDGDFVLYESSAILQYLEQRYPDPPLTPPDPRGRARVSMHIKLCDLHLSAQTTKIVFPKRFLPEERWDREVMDAAKREIEAHLAILDRSLQSNPFISGVEYGLVDIAYTPFLEFLPLMEIEPPAHVARWIGQLTERPSARATKPDR